METLLSVDRERAIHHQKRYLPATVSLSVELSVADIWKTMLL
ncbi:MULTISPECIES: hypothetical protein [unclassified Microcoleus]|nr:MULTISPECIES: hypothetical protein [unclassified Microcoleus]